MFATDAAGSGMVGLVRHIGDVAPPCWDETSDHFLVELHRVGDDVVGPEPLGCAFVTVDGSAAQVVAFMVPAMRRDYRVQALELAVRELFPHVPVTH
jgi:hypothetical protein